MIEVRPRRLRLGVLAAVAFTASVAAWYWMPLPVTGQRLENMVRSLLWGVLLGAAVSFGGCAVSKHYLAFDPRTGTIRGPSFWRWWGNVPRRAFDRIEFSVYDCRLYEVGADRRRCLSIYRWAANPRDWKLLVDAMLRQQDRARTITGRPEPARDSRTLIASTAPGRPRGSAAKDTHMAVHPESPPETAEADRTPTVLTVRVDRRRHLLTVAVCLPLAFVVPWNLNVEDVDGIFPIIAGLAGGVPGGLAGGSIALLLRRHYLSYDTRKRSIRGLSFWRSNATYPRAGYDRIEFSPYDGRIYEVRADGKRRRLIFRRWVAHQRDWRALVDLLLAQQHERGARAGD